jgi:hypothetical protein
MATAAERFHIVLSPDEKRGWNDRAAAIGVSTAEYVRRAVAAFDDGLTTEQLADLENIATEVEASAARMKTMINHVCDVVGRPIDEEAMRARASARLAVDPVEIDPAILNFGSLPLRAANA